MIIQWGKIFICYVPCHVFHRFAKEGNFELLSASFLLSFARTMPSCGIFGYTTQRSLLAAKQWLWCVRFEWLDRQSGSSCLCRGGAHLPRRLSEIWRFTHDLPGVLRRSWLRGVTNEQVKNRKKGGKAACCWVRVCFFFVSDVLKNLMRSDEQWSEVVGNCWCHSGFQSYRLVPFFRIPELDDFSNPWCAPWNPLFEGQIQRQGVLRRGSNMHCEINQR